ncbi:penicillin acylase family protein [Microbacterium terricola]|uniref:Penicillin amidase n=1 Tax=Microbacterium terricola TaxID=344163 RepID=A0ABM8DUY7_9MICO|nr:penicillin acylase family protein [Microbacterium terricola]UYK39847.1 penicillin acylase family protein [Microbacterium terricola]BDV29399.1 penicillin amidase [Microbacterium terricola]
MSKTATAPTPLADGETEPVKKRSIGRIVGISLFSLIAGVIVIALIGAGTVAFTIQRSFPQLDGTIAAAGLADEVTVQRDVLGIPTITAGSTHDLFFAQGFVHAQDRFWEMDFRRHVTSGRLSELFGESQLSTDSFLRTLGWREIAEQEVEALDETTRSYYDAYAEGVNAYLADHDGADASFEYAVLGLQNADYEIEPWTPADSVAWLKAMAWDLRSNVETESERAIAAQSYTADQLTELYPTYPFDKNPVIVPTISDLAQPASATAAPDDAQVATASISWTEVGSVIEAVGALVGDAGEGIGSNSWVVSGDLTDSGLPLLANDPHLGAALPSVWHQVGLKCRTVATDCPFDVAGFSFSGMPGVVIGHNAHIAWGFTNLTTDVTDLYVEKVQGDQYWRDGELVPLDVRTETLKVAGGDDVELEIRSTVHGPIVSGLTADFDAIAGDPKVGTEGVEAEPARTPEGEDAVSLQWTALQVGTTAEAIFALNTAQDFTGFRAAAQLFDVPAQNLIYADIEGNIGYQTPGRLPIRGVGDGSMPQPGWLSDYDWRGYIAFDELPVSYNPDSGYIVTANNAIVGDDYEHFLTRDWDYGWRAARIVDLIERKAAMGKLTADDMRDIQADNEFWMGKRLIAAYADLRTDDAGTDAALDLLQAWDAQNDADSAAAAYANVLWDELVQNLFVRGRETPAPLVGQGRLFLVVDALMGDPSSPWWTNAGIDVEDMDGMLAASAEGAYDRLVDLQGEAPANWSWGSLHALNLASDTFGASGIAPIEWLFNRGPFEVGGGSSVANATGWDIGSDFSTITVPSMRMVVDLSDLDASRWNHLTGTSGHTFHPNYVDQTASWQKAELTPWAFSPEAVAAATTNTLTLTPAE